MPVIRRLFGIVDDATPGGQDYEALMLGSPTIPDANVFYPVTGGTFDGGIERIDRNAEVRGIRANVPPLPFRAAPTVTVPVAAYRTVVEKLMYKCMGAVQTTGGGPYTHVITPIGFGSINLPACHIQMIRDDLNIKTGGATINRIALNFPLDGEGTAEVEFWGKWASDYSTAAPSVSFTGLSENPLMLRDASAYVDGSATKIQDLQGIQFTFVNNLTRKWYAGRNVEGRVLGSSPTSFKKLWWPSENKAQGAPDITYSLQFGNTVSAQELAQWFSQVQKFQFVLTGDALVGGAGTETITIDVLAGVHTGGGAEPLTARDDIPATFEGGVFYSTALSGDVKFTVLSDTSTLA